MALISILAVPTTVMPHLNVALRLAQNVGQAFHMWDQGCCQQSEMRNLRRSVFDVFDRQRPLRPSLRIQRMPPYC
jgi:hypothetical protein